jgi:uncharacterized membrane protein YfcA
MIFQPLYSLAGLFVGLLVGVTGVGGGSLMTPLLILMFGFHPSVAVGTDLLYASVTKSVGSVVHGWRGSVDWRILGELALGSLPAALGCLYILSRLGEPSAEASVLIKSVLGCALIATSAVVIFRGRIAAWSHRRPPMSNGVTTTLTIILGFIIGAAVSLSSVGAGAIGATILLILYPRLNLRRIVGTDIAHAVPLTLISGIGHWYLGTVNVSLLLSLLAGSIPGIIIGSLLASRISETILRPALAITLALVGITLLK